MKNCLAISILIFFFSLNTIAQHGPNLRKTKGVKLIDVETNQFIDYDLKLTLGIESHSPKNYINIPFDSLQKAYVFTLENKNFLNKNFFKAHISIYNSKDFVPYHPKFIGIDGTQFLQLNNLPVKNGFFYIYVKRIRKISFSSPMCDNTVQIKVNRNDDALYLERDFKSAFTIDSKYGTNFEIFGDKREYIIEFIIRRNTEITFLYNYPIIEIISPHKILEEKLHFQKAVLTECSDSISSSIKLFDRSTFLQKFLTELRDSLKINKLPNFIYDECLDAKSIQYCNETISLRTDILKMLKKGELNEILKLVDKDTLKNTCVDIFSTYFFNSNKSTFEILNEFFSK